MFQKIFNKKSDLERTDLNCFQPRIYENESMLSKGCSPDKFRGDIENISKIIFSYFSTKT